jgi:hypothetical protein
MLLEGLNVLFSKATGASMLQQGQSDKRKVSKSKCPDRSKVSDQMLFSVATVEGS